MNADKAGKKVSESTTYMTQWLRPSDADGRGYAFGGTILAWIDICAGVAAKRHANMPCVTASIDTVHFLAPVKVGDICALKASVNRTWRTSLEVGVKVESQDRLTGETKYCCHAYLTFVAINPVDGKSVPIIPVIPETEYEMRRYGEADERRQKRFETKQKSANIIPRPDWLVKGSIPKENSATSTYVEIVELVFPQHANMLGITFGGQVLKWMEHCAAMSASKFGKSYLMTAVMDSVNFIKPTKVGDVVQIRAVVSQVFDHSIEVYVNVLSENMDATEIAVTNDGWITFVAVNENDQKIVLKDLIIEDLQERERQGGADERRRKRLNDKKLIEVLGQGK